MKILLFGGSGKLGRELIKLDPKIIAPTHIKCDILIKEQVEKLIGQVKPDIVIHSVALVGTKECEEDKLLAWRVNVEGTENVVRVCKENDVRLVFISSAAIFDGKKGVYSEEDNPTPTFYYAVTKVAAEQTVKQLVNYCIVRLDFFIIDGLKYNKIFCDHFTSKIPVGEAAKKILQIAKRTDFVGIINIGQSRKMLFKIMKEYYPLIEPIRIEESSLPNFPKDISLDLTK